MPRPSKRRRVHFTPDFYSFKPAGIPVSKLQNVCLALDELEAIRLADFEGLYQEKAAEQMNVSRQTFGLILTRARKKISDVIINGKSLKIEGGNIFPLKDRQFSCLDCDEQWKLPFGKSKLDNCPNCNGDNINRL